MDSELKASELIQLIGWLDFMCNEAWKYAIDFAYFSKIRYEPKKYNLTAEEERIQDALIQRVLEDNNWGVMEKMPETARPDDQIVEDPREEDDEIRDEDIMMNEPFDSDDEAEAFLSYCRALN